MGMIVRVDVTLSAPDGTPQVASGMADLTVNPKPNDWEHEVAIASNTLGLLMSQCKEQVDMRLQDWAVAMQNIQGGRE